MVLFLRLSLVFLVALQVFTATAQSPVKKEPVRRDLIELLSPKGANVSQPGQIIYQLSGNVKLRHLGVLLFCDQATQYITANRVEAVGHVLIVQGDTIIVKADTLAYDGNNRQAALRGHVTFQDRRIILNATHLDYDIAIGVAHYANRGRLVDGRNVLTSREGYYDTKSRHIELNQGVRLVSPDNTLTADVLLYDTGSRLATLVAPTRITGKDGVSVAQQGQYDTQNSAIEQSSAVKTLKYISLGESPEQALNPVAGLAKRSEPVITKTDETMSASQSNRPVIISQPVSTDSEIDRPTANSVTTLTAAELMMRLPNTKKPAETTTKPGTSVATSNDTKPASAPSGKPVRIVATVDKITPQQPIATDSITVETAINRSSAPMAQVINQDATAQIVRPPARPSQAIAVAKAVDKPVKKPVSQPVVAVVTPARPQPQPITPVLSSETSLASIGTQPEKVNNFESAKPVVSKSTPVKTLLISPAASVVEAGPVNPTDAARSETVGKPVATPATRPDVASAKPNTPKAAPAYVAKPSDNPLAASVPSPRKVNALPESNTKPVDKKPEQPVVPDAPASVAAVMVPATPDRQVTSAATNLPKADFATATPGKAEGKRTDIKKGVLPGTAAQSVSIRKASLRLAIGSAGRQFVKPDAQIIPDNSMSDLERELNHKKRVH